MGQVRLRVIALLFWLTLFFNIERLDFDLGGVNTVNLPTSVYVVGILAAVGALLPAFQRRPLGVLMILTVGLNLLALFLLDQPILGGIDTYLTFTGIFMLTVTTLLAYRCGRSLSEFMAAVEQITFSHSGSRLHSEQEAQDLVHLEMVSSRRTQRPLSMVLLQIDPASMAETMHRLIHDIQRLMMQRYLLSTMGRVLARHLRRTDLLIEGSQPGRLVLLAPETPSESATALGERLTRLAQEQLGVTAHYSIASFPEHALTYDGLLYVAEQRLRERAPAGAISLEPEEQIDRLIEEQTSEPGPFVGAVTADPQLERTV